MTNSLTTYALFVYFFNNLILGLVNIAAGVFTLYSMHRSGGNGLSLSLAAIALLTGSGFIGNGVLIWWQGTNIIVAIGLLAQVLLLLAWVYLVYKLVSDGNNTATNPTTEQHHAANQPGRARVPDTEEC